ncbi:unnamed protein product [Auanema sp. JU1783]|nr:unnamed protein product [Auanema sp. JU1783]
MDDKKFEEMLEENSADEVSNLSLITKALETIQGQIGAMAEFLNLMYEENEKDVKNVGTQTPAHGPYKPDHRQYTQYKPRPIHHNRKNWDNQKLRDDIRREFIEKLKI